MTITARAAMFGSAALRNRQATLVGLLIVASLVLTIATSDFLTTANLRAIALGSAIDVVLVAGQAMIIIAGGFDLSIGSIIGLTASIIGLLMGGGMVWWQAMIIALAVGCACGLFNGLLVTKVGVNPLIATLGTLFIFYGIALVITKSATQIVSGPLVLNIGQAIYLGVPAPAWIALVIILIFAALMRWARFGREVYFVGSNTEAARLVGVRVDRVRITCFLLMGLLAAIAGVLALGRVGTANADTGANEELTVIAAAVLGGASLTGGEGSIIGAALGVLLIQLADDAIVLLNVPVFWQDLVVGAFLILAVAVNVLTIKVRNRISIRAALNEIPGISTGGPPPAGPLRERESPKEETATGSVRTEQMAGDEDKPAGRPAQFS